MKPFGLCAPARGFTLLELLVAIGIAALVMGVSAPAMSRLYNSMQYHGAVNDVVGLLSNARYAAIRKGVATDVSITPRTLEIKLDEKIRTLPESLRLEVMSARELNRDGAGVIRFYADGSSSGGAVYIEHEQGMSVQVQVDWLLGRVSLCQQDCGEAL